MRSKGQKIKVPRNKNVIIVVSAYLHQKWTFWPRDCFASTLNLSVHPPCALVHTELYAPDIVYILQVSSFIHWILSGVWWCLVAVNWWRHELQRRTFLASLVACSLWNDTRPTAAWLQRTESCFTGTTIDIVEYEQIFGFDNTRYHGVLKIVKLQATCVDLICHAL